MLDPDELARRIVTARTLRAMSQRDVGLAMRDEGFGLHDIAKLERQDPKAPPLNRVRREALSRVLRVPERWFTAEDAEIFEGQDSAAPAWAIEMFDKLDERVDDIIERLDALAAAAAEGSRPTEQEAA